MIPFTQNSKTRNSSTGLEVRLALILVGDSKRGQWEEREWRPPGYRRMSGGSHTAYYRRITWEFLQLGPPGLRLQHFWLNGFRVEPQHGYSLFWALSLTLPPVRTEGACYPFLVTRLRRMAPELRITSTEAQPSGRNRQVYKMRHSGRLAKILWKVSIMKERKEGRIILN